MELDIKDTAHMEFGDGRCSCCPYGYHIDLDFLRYCELSNGTYLRNLKKIERNKRKLRKSMEIFIQQQQRGDDTQMSGPPPDVVNSTDNFLHMVNYEDSATSNILEEIDTSVNATLTSIDGLMAQKKHNGGQYPAGYQHPERYHDSDDDMTDTSSSRHNGHSNNRYRTQTELMLHQHLPHHLQKSDSLSSLSSQSTHSSDFSMTGVPPGSKIRETKTTKTIHHFVAAPPQHAQEKLSVESRQFDLNDIPVSVTSEMDINDNVDAFSHVSQDSLQALRDQLATGLLRVRELEEQVREYGVVHRGDMFIYLSYDNVYVLNFSSVNC